MYRIGAISADGFLETSIQRIEVDGKVRKLITAPHSVILIERENGNLHPIRDLM